MNDRHRAGGPPPAGLPPYPRYASSAWAVLRSHATASAVAAATLGGLAAGVTGAAPADSSSDTGAPVAPLVTADCPPSGVLPGGQACVTGPAAAPDPAAAPAPAPTPAPAPAASTTPAPAVPQPQTVATPLPAPAAKGKVVDVPTTRREQPTPTSPTRVGPKRTERSAGGLKPAPAATPRATPSVPTDISQSPAGLPALTFGAPAAARAVPNVLLDRFPIPPFLLPIYQAAAVEYEVPWQVLAAINEIETDYGRNLNVSSAGAQGWMQFMPATWQTYGVDANNDGRKDPYNPADAIFAAARYLKAAGAKQDIRQAIFAYNHATWYVDSVLLRAKLIRALPTDLVDALTGLTQGRFPVGGLVRYPRSGGGPQGVTIDARENAPVIAVNDGVVKYFGRSTALGLHLILEDAHGNRYTYAHLGSVARSYAAPRGGKALSQPVENAPRDHKPLAAASAGRHRAAAATAQPQTRTVRVVKARLFAHPARPASMDAGGARQVGDMSSALPAGTSVSDYFTADFPLKRSDIVLRPLRPGAQVIGGTVIGRAGRQAIRFRVRPAGKGAPAINPRPVLDGWRLLEATNIHRGKALRGFDARNPSIGRLMLMSKEMLSRHVLADKRIRIYECGRRDIATGAIDRRVLITMSYLAASGLNPLISALQCGHSFFTASGTVSDHSSGNAVDIASIDGTAILGHQGPGSVTDVTIRRLLTLQGTMRPHQIISLMTYPGQSNTLSMSDHADHIHVGFDPHGAQAGGGAQDNAVLKPAQWTRLMGRLAKIDNPQVRR